jgi:predicted  nucleic acid-binding Zn-ribbon protein
MINCTKCVGKMFVDRQYSSVMHLETYCIRCGNRKFYHPPSDTTEGQWILNQEKLRAKTTIASL